MCLTGRTYRVHLHSSQGTKLGANNLESSRVRYENVRLMDVLRDLPHDVEYFNVKVEYFSTYLPRGLQQEGLTISSPQFQTPFQRSNITGFSPLVHVPPGEVVDVDLSADEEMKAAVYRTDASRQCGVVCTLTRDPFIEIVLKDAKGADIDYTRPPAVGEVGPQQVPLQDYTLTLSLEPFMHRDLKR